MLKHSIVNDEVGQLTNPEVPVTTIYGGHLRTEAAMFITDYSKKFSNQEFNNKPAGLLEADINTGIDGTPTAYRSSDTLEKKKTTNTLFYGFGDGTVNTDSSLTGPLKWAFEYDQ